MLFMQRKQKTLCYSDFWQQHHQNLGFELFLDQFCEDQAYNTIITSDTLCFTMIFG